MQIDEQNYSQTNFESEEFGIDLGSGHIYSMLSELYSDGEGSVVREISTNCNDAHAMSGNENRPFKITLPNTEKEIFTISFRDYGPGLSIEKVKSIYKVYGKSTKRKSNNQAGFLGVGSKSPFAITDTFYVKSYVDGICYYYMVFKDNDGKPRISEVPDEIKTTEENGLEVIIPIKDSFDFIGIIKKQLKYFKVKPLVYIAGGELDSDQRVEIDWDNSANRYFKINDEISVHPNIFRHGNAVKNIPKLLEVEQLQPHYPLDAEKVLALIKSFNIQYFSGNTFVKDYEIKPLTIAIIKEILKNGLVIYAQPGKVAFAPSRETIKYNNSTADYLIKTLVKAAKVIEKILLNNLTKITDRKAYYLQNLLETSDLNWLKNERTVIYNLMMEKYSIKLNRLNKFADLYTYSPAHEEFERVVAYGAVRRRHKTPIRKNYNDAVSPDNAKRDFTSLRLETNSKNIFINTFLPNKEVLINSVTEANPNGVGVFEYVYMFEPFVNQLGSAFDYYKQKLEVQLKGYFVLWNNAMEECIKSGSLSENSRTIYKIPIVGEDWKDLGTDSNGDLVAFPHNDLKMCIDYPVYTDVIWPNHRQKEILERLPSKFLFNVNFMKHCVKNLESFEKIFYKVVNGEYSRTETSVRIREAMYQVFTAASKEKMKFKTMLEANHKVHGDNLSMKLGEYLCIPYSDIYVAESIGNDGLVSGLIKTDVMKNTIFSKNVFTMVKYKSLDSFATLMTLDILNIYTAINGGMFDHQAIVAGYPAEELEARAHEKLTNLIPYSSGTKNIFSADMKNEYKISKKNVSNKVKDKKYSERISDKFMLNVFDLNDTNNDYYDKFISFGIMLIEDAIVTREIQMIKLETSNPFHTDLLYGGLNTSVSYNDLKLEIYELQDLLEDVIRGDFDKKTKLKMILDYKKWFLFKPFNPPTTEARTYESVLPAYYNDKGYDEVFPCVNSEGSDDRYKYTYGQFLDIIDYHTSLGSKFFVMAKDRKFLKVDTKGWKNSNKYAEFASNDPIEYFDYLPEDNEFKKLLTYKEEDGRAAGVTVEKSSVAVNKVISEYNKLKDSTKETLLGLLKGYNILDDNSYIITNRNFPQSIKKKLYNLSVTVAVDLLPIQFKKVTLSNKTELFHHCGTSKNLLKFQNYYVEAYGNILTDEDLFKLIETKKGKDELVDWFLKKIEDDKDIEIFKYTEPEILKQIRSTFEKLIDNVYLNPTFKIFALLNGLNSDMDQFNSSLKDIHVTRIKMIDFKRHTYSGIMEKSVSTKYIEMDEGNIRGFEKIYDHPIFSGGPGIQEIRNYLERMKIFRKNNTCILPEKRDSYLDQLALCLYKNAPAKTNRFVSDYKRRMALHNKINKRTKKHNLSKFKITFNENEAPPVIRWAENWLETMKKNEENHSGIFISEA